MALSDKIIRGEAASLIPLVVLGICLAVLRSMFTNVSEHDPTPEQLILPQPPFCSVPNENLDKLFYFDLGGTYCLCEKQWSVNEYWKKTLSGMAFNFPHVLNGFVAQLAVGNLFLVTFGTFVNEFIEEGVIACSEHWGFNSDPAYDLEPRYDTLMRDLVHCFLGALLAHELGKVIKCEPWLKWPMKWHWSVPSSDRQSVKRHAKMLLFGFIWWQCLLLYNADGGVNSFSLNNLMCTILVPLLFGGCYIMNKNDFENSGVNPKRVLTWHVAPCIALVVGCALSIYPVKSTIYLIMLFEGALKIMILVLEVIVTRYEWARKGMGLDVDSDPDSLVWLTRSAKSTLTDKVDVERDHHDGLGEVNVHHPVLEGRFQEFLDEDVQGSRVLKKVLEGDDKLRESVKKAFISNLSETQRKRERELNPTHLEAKKMAKMALSLCFGIFFFTMGILEPMVYDGTDSMFTNEKVHVAYGRHWCGNPKGPANGVNTCANH